jgi:uncharacterized OB-fold protein
VQIRLSGDAVIDRFCVSQRGPRRFSPPYVQSYVRLAEGPLIFTQIRGVTEADPPLRRGEPVRMGVEVAYTDDDGTDVIGWAAHRP